MGGVSKPDEKWFPHLPKTSFGDQVVVNDRDSRIAYSLWLLVRLVFELAKVIAYAIVITRLSTDTTTWQPLIAEWVTDIMVST